MPKLLIQELLVWMENADKAVLIPSVKHKVTLNNGL